jgi:hypothetical protein
LAIDPKDKETFAINLDGQQMHFCALPKGWSLSPYVFKILAEVFTDHLRDPESITSPMTEPFATAQKRGPKALKRWRRRRRRLTGARLLPFVDDFAMFENGYEKIIALDTTVFALLASLGLKVHSTKGHFLPIVVGERLDMILDFEEVVFRAPMVKLEGIATLAKGLLCRAASNKRWISVKALASLAGKAYILHLAILVAKFFSPGAARCREVRQNLVGYRKCNLPDEAGFEVVDPGPLSPQRIPHLEAHRERLHALRLHQLRMGSSIEQLRGVPRLLDHPGPSRTHHLQGAEGSALRHQGVPPGAQGQATPQSVIGVLTHLTSKSPTMMCDLRKLFLFLDTYDIKIRTRYIRSAANVWTDNLSRVTDNSDWQLAPRKFKHFNSI